MRFRFGGLGFRLLCDNRSRFFLLYGLGRRPERLEESALTLLGLGAFFRCLECALACVQFVDRKASGLLQHFREHPVRFRLLRGRRLFGRAARTGNRALLFLFDHHRLRAAMAEVLPDVARLDRSLQAQRLARRPAAQCLFGSLFRLSHALPVVG